MSDEELPKKLEEMSEFVKGWLAKHFPGGQVVLVLAADYEGNPLGGILAAPANEEAIDALLLEALAMRGVVDFQQVAAYLKHKETCKAEHGYPTPESC